MAAVKTAISMERGLFEAVEATAEEMDISRSELISRAVRAYLKRRENEQLLASINEAYGDGPDEEDRAWLSYAKRQMRRRAENDEW